VTTLAEAGARGGSLACEQAMLPALHSAPSTTAKS
jgi:hypothetical protein